MILCENYVYLRKTRGTLILDYLQRSCPKSELSKLSRSKFRENRT